MATGISAQGTTFELATGTGSAATITGISRGNPCIITSTAHGLTNGTVVALAAIGGMTELNGVTAVISHVTANTFALEQINSLAYTTYTSGGTATPSSYTKVLGAQQFTPPETSSAELDQTDLDSTAKEFILGLVDNGSFGLDCKYIEDDPGQDALAAANLSGAAKSFKVTLPNSTIFTFNGLVKGMNIIPVAGVDKILTRKVTIRVTGSVTKS